MKFSAKNYYSSIVRDVWFQFDYGKSKAAVILFCVCINATQISSISIPGLKAHGTETDTEAEGGYGDIFKSVIPSNAWSSWQAQQKTVDSLVLPIVSSASKSLFEGINNQQDEDSSLLQKTSVALFNLAGEGFNQIRNSSVASDVSSFIEQRIPQNVRTNVETTGIVIGNTLKGLGDIAFPEGENTSLIDSVSNVVNELKATGKELEQWPLQEAIVNSINEQASNFFGISPQTEKSAAAVSGLEKDAEFINGQTKFISDDPDEDSEEGMNKKKITTVIVFFLAAVSALSLIINIILTGCLVQQKSKFKKLNQSVTKIHAKDAQSQEQELKLLKLDKQIQV